MKQRNTDAKPRLLSGPPAGGSLAVLLLMAGAFCIPARPAPSKGATTEPTTQPSAAPSVAAPAGASGTQDLAAAEGRILTVFRARCANCHGPEAKKVHKFGFITDLGRMGRTPKYVHPGQPADKSKLYSTIDDDSMPPDDDPAGPLAPAQKKEVLAALKTWIEAGAPAPTAEVAAVGTNGPEAAAGPSSAAPKPFLSRLRRLTGHLHPLLAHFPIALLVAAAVAELAWLRTKESWLTGAVRFCTLFGALGAFVTAALGWVYYMDPRIVADKDLDWHRWLGTAAAAWALPVLLLSERGFRRRRDDPGAAGRPRLWFQLMLFAGVILVGVAAHFGGLAALGPDFLSF